MSKEGNRVKDSAPSRFAKGLFEGIDHILSFVGSLAVEVADSLFRYFFVNSHTLKENGYELVYSQNKITKEFLEVMFRFRRDFSEKKALEFLYRALSRACSAMPMDIALPSRRPGHALGPLWKRQPLGGMAKFVRLAKKTRCLDRSCQQRLFEVWENHDPSACLRFHVPVGIVKEITVTGSHPLLRRIFHFA